MVHEAGSIWRGRFAGAFEPMPQIYENASLATLRQFMSLLNRQRRPKTFPGDVAGRDVASANRYHFFRHLAQNYNRRMRVGRVDVEYPA
jgi:hypothetical protein